MSLDVARIREDFPALGRRYLDKPIIYLDNACTTLKPVQVVEAMNRYYFEFPGCHGRANHLFGRETSNSFVAARRTIQEFVCAEQSDEIVFTKNATEGLNLVAASLDLQEGDTVVCSDMEHNSNLLPWLALGERKKVSVRVLPSNPDTTCNLANLEVALTGSVKVVAVPHVSNLSGVTYPIREICRVAHARGALVVVDGAQAVSHVAVDVRDLGVDFYAFSAHKMMGPTGMGCLYGRRALLEKLSPFLVGGETVVDSTYDGFRLAAVPERFEAGVQNYAGAIGFARAADYLRALGASDVQSHMSELNARLTYAMSKHSRIRLIGPPDARLRGGTFNFVIDRLDSHDMVKVLDAADNVMLRAGRHCVHSWFNQNHVDDSIRVSMYAYNTAEEVDLLIAKLNDIVRYF